MRTVKLAIRAERDIEGIWDYVATDSVDAADRVRNKIKAEIAKLAESPGMGHRRADVANPKYRFSSVYSYVIAYHYTAKRLTVVRVLHGARDIGSIIR